MKTPMSATLPGEWFFPVSDWEPAWDQPILDHFVWDQAVP